MGLTCENCENDAEFWVFETWSADVGGVEAEVPLCAECLAGVRPEHLDKADYNYEFKIEAIPEAFGMGSIDGY